jgi:hypothetical protein
VCKSERPVGTLEKLLFKTFTTSNIYINQQHTTFDTEKKQKPHTTKHKSSTGCCWLGKSGWLAGREILACEGKEILDCCWLVG